MAPLFVQVIAHDILVMVTKYGQIAIDTSVPNCNKNSNVPALLSPNSVTLVYVLEEDQPQLFQHAVDIVHRIGSVNFIMNLTGRFYFSRDTKSVMKYSFLFTSK